MQEVILIIHLILAVTIIVLVLLQRSSGGGLGVGGGSGGLGDFATARSTANALTKATTICAFLFFATSLSLAYIAKGSIGQRGLLENYTPTENAAPVMPQAPAQNGEAGQPNLPAESEPPVSTE